MRRIILPLFLACMLFAVMAVIDVHRLGSIRWAADVPAALVLFVVNITMIGSEKEK